MPSLEYLLLKTVNFTGADMNMLFRKTKLKMQQQQQQQWDTTIDIQGIVIRCLEKSVDSMAPSTDMRMINAYHTWLSQR
jgi:SpoVK/Ycf46/Vps4 family AAA+-type ATPase